MFITCGDDQGRFQNWDDASVLIKQIIKKEKSKICCQVANIFSALKSTPTTTPIKKSELSSCLSCWRDVNQFRVQERLMWVSDLMSSAARLSYLPQRGYQPFRSTTALGLMYILAQLQKSRVQGLISHGKKLVLACIYRKGISHS